MNQQQKKKIQKILLSMARADENKPENDVMKLEICAACIDESTVLRTKPNKAENEPREGRTKESSGKSLPCATCHAPEILLSDMFAQRGRELARHEKIMPPIVLGELCVCVDQRQACFSFRPLFPMKLHCTTYCMYKPKL